VEIVSVLGQWVRPSVVSQLRASEFHIGVQTDMKLNHHLLKMER
jgi:hypothetical protein